MTVDYDRDMILTMPLADRSCPVIFEHSAPSSTQLELPLLHHRLQRQAQVISILASGRVGVLHHQCDSVLDFKGAVGDDECANLVIYNITDAHNKMG
jgi:hypothetical protein